MELIITTKEQLQELLSQTVDAAVQKALQGHTPGAEQLPEFLSEKQLRERYQITHAGVYYMETVSKVLQPTYVGKRKRYSREHILNLERTRTLNIRNNG